MLNEVKTTQRQSNIELCRLVAILLVLLVHTTVQSLGDVSTLGILLLEGFSIVGVNVFILITGYFSATPKKTSLANLGFICIFWCIIKVICRHAFGEVVNFKDLFFITSSNWFISSYLGLLFTAPILNSFCNSVKKRTLWGVVIALVLIEVWFDLLPPKPGVLMGSQGGYSVFSFMILYLMARAIRIYGLPEWFKKISPLLYIVCSLTMGFGAFLSPKIVDGGLRGFVFAYSNPLVILSSVSFLMTFERINLSSRFVNHIAQSTLAVLLGHTAIFFLYRKQFKYLFDHFSGFEIVGYWSLSILIVFLGTIVVDQIRILIYKPIDKWLRRTIKNNELFS